MLLHSIAYLSSLIPVLLIICGLPSTSADDKYVHTDFVLLLHDNAQSRKGTKSDDLPALKKMLAEEFPKQIPVGEQKTRLALVANKKTAGDTATWNLITTFTGDMSEFEKAMTSLEAEELADDDNKRNRKLEDGLAFVMENVFKEKIGQRPRVLVIYSTTEPGRLKSAKEKIDELTSEYGVLVLLVVREFSPASEELVEALKKELTEVAGDYGRSTPPGDIPALPPWIKEMIVNRTCNDPTLYKDRCFFKSDGGCDNNKYTPKMKLSAGDCGDRPFEPIMDMCSREFGNRDRDPCEETCDEMWPWAKQCGKDVPCGANASDARRGSYEWRQLQYCPTTLECGECETTTTSTSASSGSPTKAATTLEPTVKPTEEPTTAETRSGSGGGIGAMFPIIGTIGTLLIASLG